MTLQLPGCLSWPGVTVEQLRCPSSECVLWPGAADSRWAGRTGSQLVDLQAHAAGRRAAVCRWARLCQPCCWCAVLGTAVGSGACCRWWETALPALLLGLETGSGACCRWCETALPALLLVCCGGAENRLRRMLQMVENRFPASSADAGPMLEMVGTSCSAFYCHTALRYFLPRPLLPELVQPLHGSSAIAFAG